LCQIRKLRGTKNSYLEDGVSYYLLEGVFEQVNINTSIIVLRDTVKYIVHTQEDGTKMKEEVQRYSGFQDIQFSDVAEIMFVQQNITRNGIVTLPER
jgi:hypothetical protein